MALTIAPHLTAEELAQAARNARTPKLAQRILGIRATLMLGNATQGSHAVGMHPRTLCLWVPRYNQNGLAGLESGIHTGRPRHLPAEKLEEFKQRFLTGPSAEENLAAYRGVDARRLLAKEFGVSYSLSGVYVVLHRLNLSSLVPRPRHPKGDKAAQEAFKKTSRAKLKRSKPNTPPNALRSGSKMRHASV